MKLKLKDKKKNGQKGLKQKWTYEEDQALVNAVQELGPVNWKMIATRVEGRSSKQCRERWIGKLCPNNTTAKWTPQEDEALISLHAVFGNQWSAISKSLSGRSMIAVKNRWTCLVRKENNRLNTEMKNLEEEYNKFYALQIQPQTQKIEELSNDIWRDLDNISENIQFSF